ncbi:DUF1786 family protein [Mailhella sp.]|uniref:DUF1786 family protein n=1 Tax=Mailhella sp. TaxID=1981029 RepID=UPI0040643420
MDVFFPILVLDVDVDITSVLLALPAVDERDWPRTEFTASNEEAVLAGASAFLEAQQRVKPELVLLCGMGFHREPERRAEGRTARMDWWREELRRTEGKPERSLNDVLPGHQLQVLLELLKEGYGPVLAADSGMAAVLAALRLEALRERSWSEGVTVVYAGETHTQAFMLFRETVLGLYEHHADLPREALLSDLKEVRLNWLPDEQVRASGGHGCICGDFPPEAEGFRPTWAFGPKREILAGAARLAASCGDARFERCFGMLYGLELRRIQEAEA